MKTKLVLPVVRGVQGNWVYYSSLMSAAQIKKWVKAAKDIREAKTLDEILQRDLDARAKGISQYLQTKDSRFFNSIIVGVFGGIPDWVPFDLTEKMINLGASEEDAENDCSGMLVFHGDEKMFAIDGQHRVAGIRLAYKESKSDSDFLEDQFPVIFLAHIDDLKGRQVTRRLFSDINKNAKPVARGDRVLIDEDDEAAIVARRLYAKYKPFGKGEIISLTKAANLDADDVSNFTNLLALHTVVKEVKKTISKEKGTLWTDAVNIDVLYQKTVRCFDFLIQNTPDYQRYFVSGKLSLKVQRRNNANLLFRPIGLVLLVKLYCYYLKAEELDFFGDVISLISFKCPESPFNHILWNKGKMEAGNQVLAYRLSLYLLGEDTSDDVLLEDYRGVVKRDNARLPQPVVDA